MIFDTTHPNKDFDSHSIAIVGKSFSFFEKIKHKGVGSSRLLVKKLSDKLQPQHLQFSEIKYANIELRPKGIIVHYTSRLKRFAWVIPFYKLVIYNSQFFSIHANGHFISFSKNKNYNDNKKFIKKMITLKNDFLNLGYYDY